MKSILDKINRADNIQLGKLELGSLQSLEADIVEMQYGLKKIKELKKKSKQRTKKRREKLTRI